MGIFNFFKKKVIVSPKIGEKWINKKENPFECTNIEILDIKNEFVQYKFIDCKSRHSLDMYMFLIRYRLDD